MFQNIYGRKMYEKLVFFNFYTRILNHEKRRNMNRVLILSYISLISEGRTFLSLILVVQLTGREILLLLLAKLARYSLRSSLFLKFSH